MKEIKKGDKIYILLEDDSTSTEIYTKQKLQEELDGANLSEGNIVVEVVVASSKKFVVSDAVQSLKEFHK